MKKTTLKDVCDAYTKRECLDNNWDYLEYLLIEIHGYAQFMLNQLQRLEKFNAVPDGQEEITKNIISSTKEDIKLIESIFPEGILEKF